MVIITKTIKKGTTMEQWKIEKEGRKTYIIGKRYIAEVFNYGHTEATSYPEINDSLRREAAQNAKLIAAAPDMLAMLKELTTSLKAEIDAEPLSYDIYREQFLRAGQLINQIEGK
jgi:hypothetical protein